MHTSPLAGGGIDDVHFVADPPAGQQRVTAHFDALAAGIVHQFLQPCNVGLGNVFGIGPEPKLRIIIS